MSVIKDRDAPLLVEDIGVGDMGVGDMGVGNMGVGNMGDPLKISVLAKALAHPARLGIVQMLHERQGCIGCDIVDQIGLAQSTTSEHLRILKAAGIITGDVEGPRVCYALKPAALEPLHQLLNMVSTPKEK